MTLRSLARIVLLAAVAIVLGACQPTEPPVRGLKPQLRLLTEEQYRNVVRDVFGPQIAIGGSLDPILREEGLITASAGHATVSPSGFERFATLADGIARQVVDPANRKLLIPCAPRRADGRDDACARQFLGRTGKLLYRRPLRPDELARTVAVAGAASQRLGDFYDGLSFGLVLQLVSPNFLFIADSVRSTSPPTLTGYARATRLSFFLWNTTPDEALIDAATTGELDERRGLARQAERLMSSPRLADGVRALFADMLQFEKFATLSKDPEIYPAFDPEVAQDAREQLLKTITWHLLDDDADYRRLFDTRTTFMSDALGRIYRVPVANTAGWSRFEFPEHDGRAGIQTLAGFVALHSHPGRSSPTIRGRAVRELLLCQRVPDPPGDVDFSKFTSTDASGLPARERLDAHNTFPACAGCHKITDPIGLALENFDGAGQPRTSDAGAPIDASGTLDGTSFTDVRGLSAALSEHPAIPKCLVQRVVSYALAGTGKTADARWAGYLTEVFRDDGYRLRPLLAAVVASPNFYAVELPTVPTADAYGGTRP